MLASLALSATLMAANGFSWAPTNPGPARSTSRSLSNHALTFTRRGDALEFVNRWTGQNQTFGPSTFTIILKDGRILTPATMTRGPVGMMKIAKKPKATRAADQRKGRALTMAFTDSKTGLRASWRAVLRDDSDYVHLDLTLSSPRQDIPVRDVKFLQGISPKATVVGTVPGSPVVIANVFAGFEHPNSRAAADKGAFKCYLRRVLPLHRGTSASYSAVVGAAPPGQMRRAFLSYIESERAHPYRTFLHYNNWLDTAYGRPFTQEQCLDRITKFGEQLVRKRGVKMESFLFDDGWDDTSTVWEFNSGFPNAFLPLRDATKKYGAGPGVWLSPWGGYAKARDQRLAHGKEVGMEVDSQGFALSGPKYYKRFHDVTMDFVTRQGINMFKFDGTGSPDKTTPGSQFDSDFDAAIALIGDLRAARPDLFINLTTGTWPSPFWLRFADSTWRGGWDSSYAGVGTKRQQWITYRDGDTYTGVVTRGPLYPISSLMLHGLIYADHAGDLSKDPGNDFRDEIRSYFGEGTQLQEMYISPDRLTDQNWDDIAAAAKWSAANADVLKDTHWIGGNPNKLQVYGWASWSPRKGILVLRNPSDKAQSFSVDIAKALEMPPKWARSYVAVPNYTGSASRVFPVGRSTEVDLKPFEVVVFDLAARR